MAESEADKDEDSTFQLFSGLFLSECSVTLSDLSNPVQGRISNIKVGLVLEIYDHIPSHNAEKMLI